MGSALPVGSLALAVSQQEYFVGDIVTFKIPGSEKLLTHRVVEISAISDANGIGVIRTKGDANNVVDDWQLTDEDILGKIIFHIPYLGYLLRLPQIIVTAILQTLSV